MELGRILVFRYTLCCILTRCFIRAETSFNPYFYYFKWNSNSQTFESQICFTFSRVSQPFFENFLNREAEKLLFETLENSDTMLSSDLSCQESSFFTSKLWKKLIPKLAPKPRCYFTCKLDYGETRDGWSQNCTLKSASCQIWSWDTATENTQTWDQCSWEIPIFFNCKSENKYFILNIFFITNKEKNSFPTFRTFFKLSI